MSNAAKRVTIDNETHKIVKSLGVVDGKNRKIYKSYAVVDGKTRLCYMSELLAFTGAISAPMMVDIDGVPYAVYTLTTDGTLSIYADEALFWMCGGGAGGADSIFTMGIGSRAGGGGGGAYSIDGNITSGRYAIEIGAGGDSNQDGLPSKLGVYVAMGGKTGVDGKGGNGGTGGGGTPFYRYPYLDRFAGGTGDGIAKYPFGLLTLGAHCAGGGGGAWRGSESGSWVGGDGGSNGSNGNAGDDSVNLNPITSGGEKGGGNGGGWYYNRENGTDASFFGSGGGGGGYDGVDDQFGVGGKGYQGVVYIAIRIA